MPTRDLSIHSAKLHDAFFEDRDQELMDFLQSETNSAANEELDSLRAKAGINDPIVLAELQRVGVTSASITAFMLSPLIRLAWADSRLRENVHSGWPQASGGILGFGDKVSENERRVLNDIASSLSK